MRSLLGYLAFLATVGLAVSSGADEKSQCLDAHASSQILRKSGKLRAAQAALVFCSRPNCPGLVSSDCTSWLSEVRGEQPSIVISARDEHGQPTLDVRLTVDGELVAQRLDGNPIDVDPGEHVLRCELANGKAIESHLILSAGEKATPVHVDFETEVLSPANPQAAIATAPAPSAVPSTIEPRRSVPIAAWVTGGVGVAAAGAFAVFGLMGSAERSHLESLGCSPRCSPGLVAIAYRDDLIADIMLGVSIAAIGVAAGIAIAALVTPRSGEHSHVNVKGSRGGLVLEF